MVTVKEKLNCFVEDELYKTLDAFHLLVIINFNFLLTVKFLYS